MTGVAPFCAGGMAFRVKKPGIPTFLTNLMKLKDGSAWPVVIFTWPSWLQ